MLPSSCEACRAQLQSSHDPQATKVTSWVVGGVAGSPLAGFIYDQTGSYTGAWLMCAALFIVGGAVGASMYWIDRAYPNRLKRPKKGELMMGAPPAKPEEPAKKDEEPAAKKDEDPANGGGTEARQMLGRNTVAPPGENAGAPAGKEEEAAAPAAPADSGNATALVALSPAPAATPTFVGPSVVT